MILTEPKVKPKSSKLRKKLKEDAANAKLAKSARLKDLAELELLSAKPRYNVPKRNQHLNISPKPRHVPHQEVTVELSEEMIAREKLALEEIERKKMCVAPAYNKGAYQYIASEEQAKWIGRK